MAGENLLQYNQALSKRLSTILDISGLDTTEFAEFTNSSESHIYGMANGTKKISIGYIQKLSNKFDLEDWKFYNLNYQITLKDISTDQLNSFKQTNGNHKGIHKKDIVFKNIREHIENVLLSNGFFNNYVSVSETRLQLSNIKPLPSSKQVSQVLNYLENLNILIKKKKEMITKNGQKGNRIVDYFKVKKIKN